MAVPRMVEHAGGPTLSSPEMDEPTQERHADLLWAQPEWLAEAHAWIDEQLDALGASLTGEVEQVHLVPWSTVLRVPTRDGDLFLKAVWVDSAFEPALTALLAERWPERISEPVAVDPARGWMLTRDAGTRLREQLTSAADLHHWETLLPAYAELQIQLAPCAADLLALGVPDMRLAAIPGLLDDLLDDPEALLLDLPDGLTSDELGRMRECLPEIAAMCRELAGYGIPETLQHDDFHDGNVFVRDGRYVFFDWGDSCLSHPFHTMVVTLRSTALRLDLEPGGRELIRLRDTYLEAFGSFARHEALVEAFEIAYRVGTLGRALSWHRYVKASDPRYRSEVADAVPYGLQRFLERGPIGSWRWE
jgi:Phosphotransferase enzyme family